jgi:hypothetical protein
MPTITRCECCDLPLSMCGKAAEQRLEREQRERLTKLLRGAPWFAASFPGRCGECGEPFSAGYPVRASSKLGAYGRPCYVAACCEGKA